MNWDINTHTVSCCTCESSFVEGTQFISNIVDNDGELERRDYCIPCWEKLDKEESFYFWKSLFSPEKKKKIFIDDDTLMDFFSRLMEEDNENKQNFRYVLSLILMRKKILKFEDVCKEGDREYMIMKDKEEREYRVCDPHLNKETLSEIKQQMSSILHKDFFGQDE